MRHALTPMLAALALVGCGKSDEPGTAVSISAGNGSAAVSGGTGELTIDTPLLKGALKLPKINLTAENFDLNGVHLYPGSTIASVNVNAADDNGIVRLRFDSPASVATVRDWLGAEFAKAGTKVTVDGDSLTGKTDDERFRIDLKPAGGRASGTVTIGG